MKQNFLLLIGFLIGIISLQAQNSNYSDQYHSFLKQQFSDRYEDIGGFKEDISKYDFSPLWILPGSTDINKEENYFTHSRNELIGFIGDDYQRIYIHFIQITKNPENPLQYYVFGKSMVKNNICNFIGTIEIQYIREVGFNYHEGEDLLVDRASIKKQGVVICEYNFLEDKGQKHTGIFNGNLITMFYIDVNDNLKYNAIKGFSDNYRNNQFIGSWISYRSDKSKTCNFGEWRIPEESDLDYGAGEFSPNKSYYDKGWDPETEINYEWWK